MIPIQDNPIQWTGPIQWNFPYSFVTKLSLAYGSCI